MILTRLILTRLILTRLIRGRRRVGTVLLGLLTAAVATAWLAVPAAAHTQLAGAQPNGAGATTLTFTFDHGCEAAHTTGLTVTMPDGAIAATATGQPPGWVAEVTPSRVDWTGPPVDDAAIAAGVAEFSVLVRLTGSIGQTFWFPTVQRCADGTGYDWTDTVPDAEQPAPSLVATGAVLSPTGAAGPEGRSTDTGGGASRTQTLSAIALLVLGAGAVGYRLAPGRPQPATDGIDGPVAADDGPDADADGPVNAANGPD
ncbi:DUF1775 domain-containing protein [Solwaraspora sp. WMMD406]|uniref:DUF1775 domain-containing protein n=1 Tax=Solwaraspora sp. WMMD406 TaxID=3016095 RepID=UPI002417905E|nr:DUF1775 domain-containing protein [Solwaraspora sp. WMMD406]MDG4767676.1 DUF1775 domain-containing protein [Solwaraspora sp. WMMD406]